MWLTVDLAQPLVCQAWKQHRPRALPDQIRREESVPKVCGALKAFVALSEVAEACCGQLADLSAEDDDVDQEAADTGAFPAIVAAMRVHAGAVGVQRSGCKALSYITSGDDEAADARTQAMADAGALPVIINALQAHDGDEVVQEDGGSSASSPTPTKPRSTDGPGRGELMVAVAG